MRHRRVLGLWGLMVGVVLLFGAAPAHAVLTGPCTASGTFDDGTVVDAHTTAKVHIPQSGNVAWSGSIAASGTAMPYDGEVRLKFPPPFGQVTLDSWSGKTDSTANSGTRSYDIPSILPGGWEATVSGHHTQAGVTCSGSVVLEFPGSATAAVAVLSILAILSATAFVFSILPVVP